mmetsp:Transcript_32456/g.85730  ORF Transcript_32456/g.85730 Transcript_32456/m.85730 type:complete len:363 (-) Transcript_32456:32-1120(-)
MSTAALGCIPMGATQLYSCMLTMLLAGTVNMLLLKFQHMQMAPMSPGAVPEHFDHPWLQAALMMGGELLCLPLFLLTRTQEEAEQSRKVPKWVFLVPCCCDLTATALLCMGIALIAVSVAQMCRGTIVVFVCLLSAAFLGRRQQVFQIAGITLVMVGISMVSASAIMKAESSGRDVLGSATGSQMLAGIAFCVLAQVFQAFMFVYEEKIMSQYVVQPLHVVGMEGFFGVCISFVLLTALYPLGANTPGAFYQIYSSPPLLISIICSMVTVSVFNFSGATITQQSSAVARTTIKISSTILIWLAELAFGWNTFSLLQFFGFVFVAQGTLIYNRLVQIPCIGDSDEALALLKKADGGGREDDKA